jgi:hypothetical protein
MAANVMAEILRDNPRNFWSSRAWSLSVTDQVGQVLFAIEVKGIDAAALKETA